MNIRVILGICSLFQSFELPETMQVKVKRDVDEKRIPRYKHPVSNRCLRGVKPFILCRRLQQARNK